MGQLTEARAAWDELILMPAARAQQLTYTSGNGIAMALMNRKDAVAAHSMWLKMVPIAETQIGAESIDVVTAKTGLALTANALGQVAESANWWEQVVAANDRLRGQ